MKAILINGSTHENGCTYTALSEVANQLARHDIESEIVHIGNNAVHGCTACAQCKTLGRCIFNDLCNDIIGKMASAQALVIGSPVYFAAPNGALCAVLDRLFYAGGKVLTGKVGAAVVSCRRGGASAAFDRLNKYFSILQMPIATSQYWNSVHGNMPSEVMQDLEGLQTMRTLADNIAWLLQNLKAGNVARSQNETPVKTNFCK